MKQSCYFFFFFSLLSLLCSFNIDFDPIPSLSVNLETSLKMGNRIWRNESAGKIEGLTVWNEGEEFASLGIGHFIWYPAGACIRFKETFPDILRFFKSKGSQIPCWLEQSQGCPWTSREEFMADLHSPRMIELRTFLQKRTDLQIQFMVNRMQASLPAMTKNLEEEQKKHVMNQFYRLASSPEGLFVLLDYINFKGEGISGCDRYNGKGWGLLQVLEAMPNQTNETSAVNEFVQAAKDVLAERVKNSPPERKENKWLKGWFNRLDSYLY